MVRVVGMVWVVRMVGVEWVVRVEKKFHQATGLHITSLLSPMAPPPNRHHHTHSSSTLLLHTILS